MTENQKRSQWNKLNELFLKVYESRCPDAKRGCLVAHGARSFVNKLQEILDAQDELGINWKEIGYKTSKAYHVLNPEWMKRFKEQGYTAIETDLPDNEYVSRFVYIPPKNNDGPLMMNVPIEE